MQLEIGTKAPDFILIGTDLQPIKLEDYKGKNLILHFFPFAFSSICTAQMCAARDDENDYTQLNAAVLGVSIDSPFTLKKFAEENKLQFALGSDLNGKVIRDYQVLFDRDFLGLTHFAKRSAFVIDKNGILQYVEVTDGKTLPDMEKIKNTLDNL